MPRASRPKAVAVDPPRFPRRRAHVRRPVWCRSVLVPIGLGCHPLTQWLFLVGAIQVSVEAHCGYSVGLFAPLQRLLPFGLWGGNAHHDNHHKAPRRNFQPFFTYLDRAFGTFYAPDEQLEVAKAA